MAVAGQNPIRFYSFRAANAATNNPRLVQKLCEEGKALAYVDWSSAEFGIAAALSGDPCMKEAYQSGDPYLAFARLAGAVPPEATKKSHGHIRDLFKTVALGIQYGMGAKGLAVRLNIPQYEAMDLLGKHKRLFQSFWRWIEHVKDRATLEKQMVTVFGFQYHLVGPRLNLRSVVNFPMQANCAEILWLACCWAVENGIKVCCPVNDALLVEADQEEIQDVVAATQRIMEAASEKEKIIAKGGDVEYVFKRGEKKIQDVIVLGK